MRKALAFSGGKDSWACLWLYAKELPDIDVIWVNTGKVFPEIIENIKRARSVCPRFHEVYSNQEKQNNAWGVPSEIVPVNWTRLGQLNTGLKSVMVQDHLSCCMANISFPLHEKAKQLGSTELIRGQKTSDKYKGTSRDGDVVDGLVYRHPIEGWSDEEVLSYLQERMELPAYFSFSHSSLDCYDCTAFSAESRDKVEWMKTTHPDLFAKYAARREPLTQALKEAFNSYEHAA